MKRFNFAESGIKQFLRRHPHPSVQFMEDGAPAHRAKSTQEWHQKNGVRLFQGWPGNSPDLNIIENLWSQMKHLQRTEQATSKQGLKKIARRVWNAITPEYLEKLYESLPRRMAVVIASKGAHTKYWCICNRFVLVKTSINELTFQVGTFFLEDSSFIRKNIWR